MPPRHQTCATTLVPLILALTTLGSCRSGEGDTSSFIVRDSAGIAIVESSRAAWDGSEAWTVDTAPIVSIGAVDGDAPYLLSRVVGATRLPDGQVVVADGGSSQLRFFDSAGVFRQAVGRKGTGPGEFEYLRALERCGADSLFAFNINWQTKVFTSAGTLGREMAVREPGATRVPYALACSRVGLLAISGWGDRPAAPPIGFHRAMSRVWVLDGDGRERANLGSHLASERIGNERGSGPHPFGRHTSIAVGADAIYLGDGAQFEVRRYTPDGKLERIQRAPPEDLTISPAMVDAYRSAQLGQTPDQRRPALERSLAEMPMPEGRPAFTRLRVDSEGNLWAARFRVAGGPEARERWAVFSDDGSFLGHVEMPPSFALLEIGEGAVLGVAKDEEGVERVRRHRLARVAPARRDR